MISDDHDLKIYIVGTNQLHYELISFCLKNELNARCIFHSELAAVNFNVKAYDRPQILLIDCLDCDINDLRKRLDLSAPGLPHHVHLALFNVGPECKLETFVKQHNVCGIFYRDDTRHVFIKGIRTILDGHLWLSRKLMSDSILMPFEQCSPINQDIGALSGREKAILESVASGASNQEIADQLNISVHTVKTHLYRIYRKINVPNRMQAALWVSACLAKYSAVHESGATKCPSV